MKVPLVHIFKGCRLIPTLISVFILAFWVMGWRQTGSLDPSRPLAFTFRNFRALSIGISNGTGIFRYNGQNGINIQAAGQNYVDAISLIPIGNIKLLDGRPFTRVTGYCGISDDSCSKDVTAICQIIVDNKVIFQSGIISKNFPPAFFDMQTNPSSIVELYIYPVSYFTTCDSALWINLTTG